MNLIPGLTHAVLHLLHTYGIAALFVLLLVEEAGIPLPAPGDTLIALAGAQPHRTLLYSVEVLTACTLAVFLGSSALYWLMRVGGHSFIARYGRYLRLKQQRLDQIEAWIEKRGTLAIILGRLIPGLRIPTTVMCGLTGVPYRVYGPSAALAGLIWSAIYYALGALLQRRLGFITSYFAGLFDTIGDSTLLSALGIASLIALVVGVWGLVYRWRARRANTANNTDRTKQSEMAADTTAHS